MFHNKDYEEFKNELRKVITPDTVFVCIGTNKVIFDIFGPLCGSKLKRKKIPCFGDCKNNVNAINMYDRLEEIYKINNIENKNIIAIDASITEDVNKLNKIELKRNRGVKPGAGMGKVFPSVGQHSVLMYTLLREDLNKVLNGYKYTMTGKRHDKADMRIIRSNAIKLVEIIEEIYNEVCNENLNI